jgi:hypothetical protein
VPSWRSLPAARPGSPVSYRTCSCCPRSVKNLKASARLDSPDLALHVLLLLSGIGITSRKRQTDRRAITPRRIGQAPKNANS